MGYKRKPAWACFLNRVMYVKGSLGSSGFFRSHWPVPRRVKGGAPIWESGSQGPTSSRGWCYHHDAMLCYAKSLQSCLTLCDPIDGSPPAPQSLGKVLTNDFFSGLFMCTSFHWESWKEP